MLRRNMRRNPQPSPPQPVRAPLPQLTHTDRARGLWLQGDHGPASVDCPSISWPESPRIMFESALSSAVQRPCTTRRAIPGDARTAWRAAAARLPGVRPARVCVPGVMWSGMYVGDAREGEGFWQLVSIAPWLTVVPVCQPGSEEAARAWSTAEISRRRDCHFDDTPFFIPIEPPTKGRGGCSRMTVSPTARRKRFYSAGLRWTPPMKPPTRTSAR